MLPDAARCCSMLLDAARCCSMLLDAARVSRHSMQHVKAVSQQKPKKPEGCGPFRL